jgi:hypothetical protein
MSDLKLTIPIEVYTAIVESPEVDKNFFIKDGKLFCTNLRQLIHLKYYGITIGHSIRLEAKG